MLLKLPPDLATLMDLASAVEPACVDLLTPILPTFSARAAATLPDEYAVVTFAQNEWSGRWLPDGAGNLQHATWRYMLTLAIHTVRKPENSDGSVDVSDLHLVHRSKLRTAIAKAVLDPQFLPWHCIASLNEKAATESIQESEDSDVSALVFDGLITIRSDAMAAVNVPA